MLMRTKRVSVGFVAGGTAGSAGGRSGLGDVSKSGCYSIPAENANCGYRMDRYCDALVSYDWGNVLKMQFREIAACHWPSPCESLSYALSAGVIQLVECQLPKLDVAGSSPVARSAETHQDAALPEFSGGRLFGGVSASIQQFTG